MELKELVGTNDVDDYYPSYIGNFDRTALSNKKEGENNVTS